MLKRTGLALLVVPLALFLLFLAPRRLASADQGAGPDFGPIVVARDVSFFRGQPIDVLDAFPSGMKRLIAIFKVKNAPGGAQIEAQWFRNGESATNPTPHVLQGPDTTIFFALRSDAGLAAGDWEIRIRYLGAVVDTAKFKIANKLVIFPLKFGEDFTLINHELINPQTDFAAGTQSIAAVFYYANLPVGTKVDALWYVNDELLITQHPEVESGSGIGAVGTSNALGLASGMYQLRILVNGKVEQFAQVTIKAAS
jgi:hypothetical protein